MKPFLALLLVLLLGANTWAAQANAPALSVQAIPDLPENFILGMDVSSMLALNQAGVRYFDQGGQERDLFAILKDNGINYIRVRVWNDPYDANGHGYGGGNNDIEAALEIGKRATANGMKLLVDFHYSDFWADPGKQQAPKAWQGLPPMDKAKALGDYTRDCLTRLKDAGVDVGMVQLGNETNGRFCGEQDWTSMAALWNAGSAAVREIYPDAWVAVHFTNPENAPSYAAYAAHLHRCKVDYDVFATSYYPYWHGTLDNLKAVLSDIQASYGKQVLVAETAYAYTLADGDFHANTIGEGGGYAQPHPFTQQGQADHVADVIRAMHEIGGLGVFYWEGAWIPVGGASWAENRALWEQYGAGWASSFAREYDPQDAGRYYGGCAWENQAMFDFTGKALDSLQVFKRIR